MKQKKIAFVCSIIFIVVAGIWYQSYQQPERVQEEVLLSGSEVEIQESAKAGAVVSTESGMETKATQEVESEELNQESVDSESTEAAKLCCYVCGAVKNPGVFEYEQGERLSDVIALAGGFTKEADQTYLNLAKLVEDSEKIYVPTKDEVKDGKNVLNAEVTDSQDGETSYEENKVDVNTADVDTLTTLPGIGQAKAQSIVSYREEHGRFKSIEEIKNIEGIKDGVFQKIQNLITV